MKKIAKNILLFVFLLSLFTPSQSARADVAPPPVPGLGGLRPLEYQSTEVQMIYERVELNLQPAPELNVDYSVNETVDVTAWFVLRNTGKNDESMKVSFPLDSLNACADDQNSPRSRGIQELFIVPDSFRVENNGRRLETQTVEIDGIDCVGWATFDVQFPVQKDVLIKIDYSMTTWGVGHDLMLEYVLETGAGWKGSIQQAYVVFRFPYLISAGNIDNTYTTNGYQSLYNEIFWSYRDFEPTPDDNIIVAFFEPYEWMKIQGLDDQVDKNPTDVETWLKLFNEYANGMPYYSSERRNSLFEKAIKYNPNNSDLYAFYAEFLMPECCYYRQRGDTTLPVGAREYANSHIIPLLDHTFELEPNNKRAGEVLESLEYVFPDLTYTPPPTIPPTATSPYTATPSITPSVTITPIPSDTPVVVTVIQTKLVNAPTSTPKPETPTATAVFTETPVQAEPQKETSTTPLIFGAIILFVVGIGVGTFWQKRKMSS